MVDPPHVTRVLCGPIRGIHSTHTLSGQHFGRHWHDAYGFGILEDGAQRSASGRGRVDAFAGQLITSNPGEVHDGSPLGGPTRRWRILSAEMAAMAGLSRYQLLRRFEKAYGLPPHAWLLSRRAEYALCLIRGGQPLAEAAMASGFADQSHMTRVFVRHFGFTPGVWRKSAAALQ